jgi:hypothetical protein
MLDHRSWRSLLVAVFVCLAAFAPSHPLAAPSPAAPVVSAEVIVSERASDEYSPKIAYNSQHNEYLVVWENLWPGGHHDVYAQRVSAEGQLLSWFAVASGAYKQMNPSVAYDPVNDRYLVVFAYDYSGNDSDWDIYGRFIPWNGPNASLLDFPICDWNSQQRRPAVAYARTQQEYLVTWTNAPTGQPTYISARRIFADGSGFPANPFLVSSGTENRDFQDVTYNLARNEYLVTWDIEKSGSGLDIYGIRLSATGGALTGGSPAVTGEFPIAGWPADEEHPAVAACAGADQYLVAWQSDQDTGGSDYAIYARFLNGDAVPGTVTEIVDTSLPQVSVDIACSGGGQTYLLAWQDKYVGGEYGIWARLVHTSEAKEADFELVGPRAAADRQYPALAAGRGAFLAAWEHDRDGGTNVDIHARLVGNFVFLPLLRK